MTQNKYAVTGGIGSGKSLVCAIIREAGFPVYSCDEIYRDVLQDKTYQAELYVRFPDCFSDGVLNKSALANRIFCSEEDNRALNSLAHPRIMKRLYELSRGDKTYFAEVPLLYEAGLEGEFDGVIAVTRNQDARIAAVCARDGITKEQVTMRMARQFCGDYAQKNCLIIGNDGTVEELRLQVFHALKELGLK